MGLRDFLKKFRLNYLLYLAMKTIKVASHAFLHAFMFLANSKCIT